MNNQTPIITREINGIIIDIALTQKEINDIYYYQDNAFIKNDCHERIVEKYGEKMAEYLLDSTFELFNKYESNDPSWSENLDEAIAVSLSVASSKIKGEYSRYGLAGNLLIEEIKKAVLKYDAEHIDLGITESSEGNGYYKARIFYHSDNNSFGVHDYIAGKFSLEDLKTICDTFDIGYEKEY